MLGSAQGAWVEALRTGSGQRTDGLHRGTTGKGGICGQRRDQREDAARGHAPQTGTGRPSHARLDDHATGGRLEQKGGRRFLPQVNQKVPAPLKSWKKSGDWEQRIQSIKLMIEFVIPWKGKHTAARSSGYVRLPTLWMSNCQHAISSNLMTNENSHHIVLSGNIVVGETQRQILQANILTGVTEQAIIDMLATLSLPIFIREEIDDEGLPFYVWHLGESTPEQPFGVCVGVHRQFLGALKLAMEKAIKGIQE